MDFYVSTEGSARWSGRLPEPAESRRDGPWPSLEVAREKIRGLIRGGSLNGPVNVFFRGGVYRMSAPVTFTHEDSYPVTYASYPGETAILDGGSEITGWAEETVNGIRMWTVTVPGVAEGAWYFKQLFADGERRERTRWPAEGVSTVKELPGYQFSKMPYNISTDRFIANAGDIDAGWKNLNDVCIVAFHYWAEEHLPIKSYDPETGLCVTSLKTSYSMRDDTAPDKGADYYCENVFEALGTPGRWYLDRTDGKLYYVPLEGEKIDETRFMAPYAKQLVIFEGKPEERKFIEYIKFKNLTFRNTECADYAPSSQSAPYVAGVLYFKGARHCAIEDCHIRNIGSAAIEFEAGSTGNHIVGNDLYDIGATGIKLMGPNVCSDSLLHTGFNTVTDNRLHKLGRIFTSGAGVLATNSSHNIISHNEIHDLYYSGISSGWVWGYELSASCDNLIEKNHIYDLGQGVLSDLGGIYTLGVQPGTVIRGNLIHGVEMRGYGGWGIYPDEGSSNMIIEDNIVYDCSAQAFHQHYGRENLVRNNILAFGRQGQAIVSLIEDHNSVTFERNIFLAKGMPMYTGNGKGHLERNKFRDISNLYWDYDGVVYSSDLRAGIDYSIDEIKAMGKYNVAVFADPKCKAPENRDFTLADDSPALAFGFKPIDMSDVGPRKRN